MSSSRRSMPREKSSWDERLGRVRDTDHLEGLQAKEIDAPAYYSGTKLAYFNDRKNSSSEMPVRSGATTIAINMHPSWPGGANNDGLMELQFHDVVQPLLPRDR